MNINYKESQIDFLSHVGGKAEESARPRYMAAQMSLSLENLVIFAIVAIMVVIFSFSLGIERGKGVALTPAAEAGSDAKEVKEVKDFKADTQKMKAAPSSSKAVVKAKTPAAAPLVAMAKSAGTGAYTLQVASYKGIKSAQREADKLKQKGFDNVYVLPKGTYTIVCVGNFQNKEDASGIKRQLNNRYQGSVVRRL
jgi:septal ring-binding cell division protein DamX